METVIVYSAIEIWLLRRLGVEPLSRRGRLVAWLIHFSMILLPALLLAAVTSQWGSVPIITWTIIAAVYGGFVSIGYVLFGSVIKDLLSWVWSIADEADLRRFVAWQRRWYNHRVYIPVSAVLTLGIVLPLYFLAFQGPGVPVPVGALYIGVLLVFLIIQSSYGMVMMAPQAYILSTCKHRLFGLSPADSVTVRRSLRGYNRFGTLVVSIFTLLILLLTILLPGSLGVIAPVVLALLLVEYVCTAIAILVPRLMIERLIRAKKEEEMEILQVRLNDLLPQVGKLNEEEQDEMTQLQETHHAIRDSPENLLPLGAILRNVGALLLSTATILVAAFAEEWIAGLVKFFQP
jgi:hypothetical protein